MVHTYMPKRMPKFKRNVFNANPKYLQLTNVNAV